MFRLLALFFGIPLVLMYCAPLIMGLATLSVMSSALDTDRYRIESAFSSQDVAFGGDAKQLLASYKRLRDLSATPADGRINNRFLSVAVVTLTSDRAVARRLRGGHPTVPIDLDLGEAGQGAVLVMADRPVVWRPVNTTQGQRAKFAFEGDAVFDLDKAPHGLMAGFRIGAFGARDASNPLDIDHTASRRNRQRFCSSIKTWAKHFQVEFGDVRLWRMTDPDRIALARDTLSASGGSEPSPEYVSDLCR
jgi:hypothetical protein